MQCNIVYAKHSLQYYICTLTYVLSTLNHACLKTIYNICKNSIWKIQYAILYMYIHTFVLSTLNRACLKTIYNICKNCIRKIQYAILYMYIHTYVLSTLNCACLQITYRKGAVYIRKIALYTYRKGAVYIRKIALYHTLNSYIIYLYVFCTSYIHVLSVHIHGLITYTYIYICIYNIYDKYIYM